MIVSSYGWLTVAINSWAASRRVRFAGSLFIFGPVQSGIGVLSISLGVAGLMLAQASLRRKLRQWMRGFARNVLKNNYGSHSIGYLRS
jgi:hypothetical protein